MDFNCDQRDDVHFFYTLPFSKNRALVETTWLSNLEDQSLMDYDLQLENYIKNNFYTVKFDGETKDTIVFNNHNFCYFKSFLSL